jgi:hypothetical protein
MPLVDLLTEASKAGIEDVRYVQLMIDFKD